MVQNFNIYEFCDISASYIKYFSRHIFWKNISTNLQIVFSEFFHNFKVSLSIG